MKCLPKQADDSKRLLLSSCGIQHILHCSDPKMQAGFKVTHMPVPSLLFWRILTSDAAATWSKQTYRGHLLFVFSKPRLSCHPGLLNEPWKQLPRGSKRFFSVLPRGQVYFCNYSNRCCFLSEFFSFLVLWVSLQRYCRRFQVFQNLALKSQASFIRNLYYN